jgi:DNA-directed RNA polymerase subunit beta'
LRCGSNREESTSRKNGPYQTGSACSAYLVFQILPNKIGYLLGVSSKKLETIVYYERFVVIQPGIRTDKGQNMGDLSSFTEEEYLDILDSLYQRITNTCRMMIPISSSPRWVRKPCMICFCRIDLDQLSFDLRNAAATETSQQRKADALKRLSVVEAFP